MTATPEHTKKTGSPRRRRALVLVLVVLGALCILVSTVSVWIRDVALDTDTWADTSAQILDSPDVQQALAVYIVDQSYAATDAQARLEAALPPELKPLAGPLAAQAQGLAYNAAARALARPRVQDLWVTANAAAHEQLVALLEGNTERVQLTNDAVVLNMDAIVANVAARVGAGANVTETVQQHVEPIVIMRSDQLDAVQKAVRAIKALSFWPLLAGLAMWAGAVYIAAGRRRETIRALAISLVILGLVLLVVRRIGGNAIVDNLVQTDSVKPAVHDVWTIFTSLLADSAVAGVVVGLLGIGAAALAGPTRWATTARRWLAPTFRDHAGLVHGALAGLILLLLLWGPAGTPRRLITLLVVIALAFVGLEVLRRQTVREFPHAKHGEIGLGSIFGRRARPASPAAQVDAETVDRLERLASLHDRGALTDDEYAAEKALLLR